MLGRIGLAWMFAALLYMRFGLRTRIVLAAGILAAYSLVLHFVGAPTPPEPARSPSKAISRAISTAGSCPRTSISMVSIRKAS